MPVRGRGSSESVVIALAETSRTRREGTRVEDSLVVSDEVVERPEREVSRLWEIYSSSSSGRWGKFTRELIRFDGRERIFRDCRVEMF